MKRIFIVLSLCVAARADEGMWLFNQFPKDRVKARYGVAVTDQMLDHLRLSSVRMGSSGSFVSPHGLLFTNHHVGLSCVQKASSPAHNYVAEGFLAKTQSDEIRCPGLEVSVLERIEDVTARVSDAVTAGAASAAASDQRKAAIAGIEKGCGAQTGLHCEVVTLYAGARHHLYIYKRYADVRLVFTPEFNLGFFGGDPDNFTYPRYCLDVNFLRAYENGKPADTRNYLKWSREGAREGEAIFVAGHPANSSRLATLAELEFRRDHLYPFLLDRLASRIAALKAFGSRSAENARLARTTVFGAENSQKRLIGFLAGSRDPSIMRVKQAQERKLRAAIENDPKLRREYGQVWAQAAGALKAYASLQKRYAMLETGAITGSDLFGHARNIVRLGQESAKPNGERLREFTDAALPAVERRLYSQAPISGQLEIAVIAEYFGALAKALGPDDPLVKAVLAGKSPVEAAGNYVKSSKLGDLTERRRLAANREAVASCDDGMIRLARLIDGPARSVRKQYEDNVDAVLTAAKSRIAQARFTLHGANEYPDATGTLRLSYGVVKGYTRKDGKRIPWATNFAGLYERATGQDPYKLPGRWLEAKSRLNLSTPFNFAGTTDTHGGNSGSPTVNAKGEIVGILFDSNLEKLPNEFVYTDTESRSVHVASQGIVEALRVVYKADGLLKELLGQ